MNIPRIQAIRLVGAGALAALMTVPMLAQDATARNSNDKKQKPSVALRANPSAGFSPLKVTVAADIRGGDDDYEEFYCPSVEWTWGDDTKSESMADCDPYEAGKSKIRRRYTITRVFQTAGDYKVEFRLKQKNKVVGSGSTTVQVRPGVRDGMGCCSER